MSTLDIDSNSENSTRFGWLLIILLLVGAVITFFISYSKTETSGWEAAEVRNCIGRNPTMTVQIDRDRFNRYCQMDDETVGVQALERDEKGNYSELRSRIEHSLRDFNTVKINVWKNGWKILDRLP